jgi:outer membrane receptor for ferrienterochelin and colicin
LYFCRSSGFAIIPFVKILAWFSLRVQFGQNFDLYMNKNLYLFLFMLITSLSSVYAQDQELDSLLNMNAFTEESELQKELNKATKVASGKALSTRETPGILSVISSEEIQNAGARDIIDVLRMVPGFDVGQDVNFITGVSMRGNWAHEGKVLILLNGFQMNDLLYQNTPLANRFPIDFIERIEIIRGPGSALYGGAAEYGVINIVTKSTESLNGVIVTGAGGFHADAIGRLNAGVMIGEHKKNYSWDFSAYAGSGIVSDNKNFQSFVNDSQSQNLINTTQMNPTNLGFGFASNGLTIRGMFDQYSSGDPLTRVTFNQGYGSIQYDWKVSKKLTVTPRVMYTSQEPWSIHSIADNLDSMRVRAQRVQASVNLSYSLSRKLNFDFGTTYFQDDAKDLLDSMRYEGGTSNNFSFNNYALYAQGLLKTRLANITFGFRYEKNSRTDAAFVPRLAFTKKIENFHFKALYSEAFRTPSIENINIAYNKEKMKPELSTVFEVEVGYQFTPSMLLSINGFSLSNKNVIIYGYYASNETNNTSNSDYYKNFDKTGTQGVEVVYALKKKNWYGHVTYSFAQAIKDNTVDTYQIPQTDKQYTGQLMQKLTVNTCFTIAKGLTVNPTMTFGGKRYAYADYLIVLNAANNPTKVPISTELNPYALVNLFFNYRHVLINGLTIGAGVYDLFNERPITPQSYNSGIAPIPGRSREYVLKISYQLDFKK